ncbi:hypothetical protein [Aneurinibacillus sp. UBA3580]|uniref:hypothetical protein n=1 Tax=Aneurinibacillus sp. UBA3580 TaxID=1946041 RepID=UPI0025809560|nr:hypothetical protein [Aneurinibacillus sp. UBA3580]
MAQPMYAARLKNILHFDATYTKHKYFLLTHKPFRTIELQTPQMAESVRQGVSEAEFLKNYLLANRDAHKFIAVLGDNGSGKSHFIRWLKEMYIQHVSEEEEAIVFIARVQSTLRGALEQIIQSDVLKNHEMTEKLKALIQANEHLGTDNLKNNIIHQFAIAVTEHDGESGIRIKKSEKSRLYEFLVSSETQDLLLREDGPIERICKKLASEAKNEVMVDVTPRFEAEDFYVRLHKVKEIERAGASKKAVKFLEDIAEPASALEREEVRQRREAYAGYLNQFLDKVVQQCTQLRGTDLKDVLITLRQELKKQGKNLTLFIEDITAFTGIDKALVDALIAEHEEVDFNKDMCRIVSVVGITNSYYQNFFPDNLKNRLTYRVLLDNMAIGTPEDIADMAARYINAIYLEEEEIDRWYAEGAQIERLPVADRYREHASWASCETKEGLNLPIYPFNRQALGKLCSMYDIRTPREFLQKIFSAFMMLFFKDETQFPPPISKFIREVEHVPMMHPADEALLRRQVETEQYERYATLLRIWGDCTLTLTEKGERLFIGGVEEKTFDAFRLPLLREFTGHVRDEEPEGEDRNDRNEKPQPPAPDTTAKSKRTEREPKKLPPQPPTSPEPTPVYKQPSEFEKAQSELEKWALGQPLANERYRDDLLKAIADSVLWESEGIPASVVHEILSKNRVGIEGQTAALKAMVSALVFARTPQLKAALEALAAWRILGKRSWSFPGAADYAPALFTWIESEKTRIIEYVRRPLSVSSDDWRPADWASAAEFYLTAFTDGFAADTPLSATALYEAFLRHPKTVRTEPDRSKAWQHLQQALVAKPDLAMEHTESSFLRFLNRVQGDIMKGAQSSVFTLDAAAAIQALERLLNADFDIDSMRLPEKQSSPYSWYRSSSLLYLIKERLDSAITEEKQRVEETYRAFVRIVGARISEVDLFQLHNEMKKMASFLREHKEPFSSDLQNGIENSPTFAADLAAFAAQAERLQSANSRAETLLILSANPVKAVTGHLDILRQFDQLMDQIQDKYRAYIDDTKSEVADSPIMEEARTCLENLQQELLQLKGGASYAT